MVEIARNLNQDDLRVLIMDEPTSSLSAAEVKVLFKIMRELLEAGISIVYISHRLEEIMEIGDHVTILRDGKYVADADVKDHPVSPFREKHRPFQTAEGAGNQGHVSSEKRRWLDSGPRKPGPEKGRSPRCLRTSGSRTKRAV